MSNVELLRYLLFFIAALLMVGGVYVLVQAHSWWLGFLNLFVYGGVAALLVMAAFHWAS